MGPVTSIAAGVAATLGAVALYRAVERRIRNAKKVVGEMGGAKHVIDFEFDRTTGAYRCK